MTAEITNGRDAVHLGANPIQYTLAQDDTGPVEIEPRAVWPQHPDCVDWWQCAVLTYADGLKVVVDSGAKNPDVPGRKSLRSAR